MAWYHFVTRFVHARYEDSTSNTREEIAQVTGYQLLDMYLF